MHWLGWSEARCTAATCLVWWGRRQGSEGGEYLAAKQLPFGCEYFKVFLPIPPIPACSAICLSKNSVSKQKHVAMITDALLKFYLPVELDVTYLIIR